MRDIRTRRLAWAALPVAAVLLLAGCSDDDDDKGSSTTSPSAPATSAPATPPAPASSAPAAANPATFSADQKGASDAYTKLFDASTPVDQRKALIQDADQIAPLLDALLANPAIGSASVKVNDVTVTGDKAQVKFDVLLGGVPAYGGQTGDAVKQNGKWLVGKGTLCQFGGALQVTLPPACSS